MHGRHICGGNHQTHTRVRSVPLHGVDILRWHSSVNEKWEKHACMSLRGDDNADFRKLGASAEMVWAILMKKRRTLEYVKSVHAWWDGERRRQNRKRWIGSETSDWHPANRSNTSTEKALPFTPLLGPYIPRVGTTGRSTRVSTGDYRWLLYSGDGIIPFRRVQSLST